MDKIGFILQGVESTLAGGSAEASRRGIQEALMALRALVGMEVAFVGYFTGGQRRFDFVDSDPAFSPVTVGASDPLEATYCAKVAAGSLDQMVPDTGDVPALTALSVTRELSIGSYLSAPMRDEAGELLGTLCCFSRASQPDMRQRDVDIIDTFAALIGRHMRIIEAHDAADSVTRAAITSIVAAGGPVMALQPIVGLSRGITYGYEALARFPVRDGWGPETWFAEAARLGIGHELEAAAIHKALLRLDDLRPDVYLSVNVSADALCHSEPIMDMLTGPLAPRLVVELTEHSDVREFDELHWALARIRMAGARIAVDDAGSGYAGLEQILLLQPEVLKLDRVLVQGLHHHIGRYALCASMVNFTAQTGATLIAEGVETDADLGCLRDLGVPLVQGYLLGRPALQPREADTVTYALPA